MDSIMTMRSQTMEMIQCLPDEELTAVNSIVKMLIRAWDPDFAKVTKEEEMHLLETERQIENGEYYTEDEVWSA